jgi:iron complex transport system ATP-binding protein
VTGPLLEARGLALAGRLAPTDLRVQSPQLVCLVGPNGSGKTSLLHALARIGGPEGEVRIAGEDPGRLPPALRKRRIAYFPASRDIAWPMAARDVVRLGSSDGAEEALDLLDLLELADRRMDRLSTGERSRVLIARALAQRSTLMLLDEPTANLDPAWQIRLMQRLREASARSLVVAALHDLDLAARHADRLIVMDKGRVAADGLPAALLAGAEVTRVFGVERGPDGAWRLAPPGPGPNPSEDRRSSR